jgi:hypothetical protein
MVKESGFNSQVEIRHFFFSTVSVETGFGAHPAPYQMDIGDFYPSSKAAGA